MSAHVTSPESDAAETAWAVFDTTTSRWGRITMIIAMLLLVGGPALLAAQVGVSWPGVVTGIVAIAAAFGVVWVVEPLSYFPILGPASMYQAFMIGNISNKLLPAAIVAQATIEARSDTKRGQLAAVLAICGAATTHLLSLAIFVGLLGSLLLAVVPADITSGVQTFVLPAVMGAVLVQMIVNNPRPRIISIAVIVGAVVTFVLTPLVPALASFGVAIAVVLTIVLALAVPARGRRDAAASTPAEPSE